MQSDDDFDDDESLVHSIGVLTMRVLNSLKSVLKNEKNTKTNLKV